MYLINIQIINLWMCFVGGGKMYDAEIARNESVKEPIDISK